MTANAFEMIDHARGILAAGSLRVAAHVGRR
jgi:hypothetical protein